jgi:hypothetical protein
MSKCLPKASVSLTNVLSVCKGTTLEKMKLPTARCSFPLQLCMHRQDPHCSGYCIIITSGLAATSNVSVAVATEVKHIR